MQLLKRLKLLKRLEMIMHHNHPMLATNSLPSLNIAYKISDDHNEEITTGTIEYLKKP